MKSKYYAMMYNHDGVLIVEMNDYDEENVKLLNNLNHTYSLGGIISGQFIGKIDLGCYLVSLDEFIKDQTV